MNNQSTKRRLLRSANQFRNRGFRWAQSVILRSIFCPPVADRMDTKRATARGMYVGDGRSDGHIQPLVPPHPRQSWLKVEPTISLTGAKVPEIELDDGRPGTPYKERCACIIPSDIRKPIRWLSAAHSHVDDKAGFAPTPQLQRRSQRPFKTKREQRNGQPSFDQRSVEQPFPLLPARVKASTNA